MVFWIAIVVGITNHLICYRHYSNVHVTKTLSLRRNTVGYKHSFFHVLPCHTLYTVHTRTVQLTCKVRAGQCMYIYYKHVLYLRQKNMNKTLTE